MARNVTLTEEAETSNGVLKELGDVPMFVRDSDGSYERVAAVGYDEQRQAYVIEAEQR